MKWETVGSDIPRNLTRMGTLQYGAGKGCDEQPASLLWSLQAGLTGVMTQLDLASECDSGYIRVGWKVRTLRFRRRL